MLRQILAVLLVGVAAAYLAVDFFFRFLPLGRWPEREALQRAARFYAGAAALCCLTGTLWLWLRTGLPGAAAGALSWIPWWLFWRFGIRKQFPSPHQHE